MKTICLRASIPVLSLLACAALRTAAAPLVAPTAQMAQPSSMPPTALTAAPKAAPSPVVRPATTNRMAQPPKRRTFQRQTTQRQTLQPQTPTRMRLIRPRTGSAAVQPLPNRPSSTRLAAPPLVRQGAEPSVATPQLAPDIVQSLNTHGVWVDPSLRGLADANAMERAAHDADFPVRVLVVRRAPKSFASVQSVAQVVHQQLQLKDGLVIIATGDDARLGLFGAGLDDGLLNQIVEAGAQTWTQEGYAPGVAQTLRLVAYERKVQAQARFIRVAVPGAIGVFCLLGALTLWIRRKIKHRARRAISKTLPTTIPALDDDVTSVESSSAEAV